MKNCSRSKKGLCSQKNPQPLSNFYSDKHQKDGLNKYCKICSNKDSSRSQKRHAKKAAARAANWRKNHPDYSKTAMKVYSITDKCRFMVGVRAAKKRNYIWEISFDQWKILTKNGSCHYCDGKLALTGHGLDRKDNNLGYTLSNVVTCCAKCNRIKCNLVTYHEMILIGLVFKGLKYHG